MIFCADFWKFWPGFRDLGVIFRALFKGFGGDFWANIRGLGVNFWADLRGFVG